MKVQKRTIIRLVLSQSSSQKEPFSYLFIFVLFPNLEIRSEDMEVSEKVKFRISGHLICVFFEIHEVVMYSQPLELSLCWRCWGRGRRQRYANGITWHKHLRVRRNPAETQTNRNFYNKLLSFITISISRLSRCWRMQSTPALTPGLVTVRDGGWFCLGPGQSVWAWLLSGKLKAGSPVLDSRHYYGRVVCVGAGADLTNDRSVIKM